MASRTRTEAAALKSADEAARFSWDDYTPDSDGFHRYSEADLASAHLASLSPERRAQLEREWLS